MSLVKKQNITKTKKSSRQIGNQVVEKFNVLSMWHNCKLTKTLLDEKSMIRKADMLALKELQTIIFKQH